MIDRIYLFLIRNDVWIYIVSVLGLFWYSSELIRAVRTLRRAMFNLERETATAARNHALGFILFFAVVIGLVFYVNRNIAPYMTIQPAAVEQPTPDIFSTPLLPPTPITTPDVIGGLPVAPVLAPTVTLSFLPGVGSTDVVTDTTDAAAETPVATPTPFQTCTPDFTLTEPLNGSLVFQRAVFRGTANTGELHQYIIELNGPQTAGAWAPIMQEPARQPIINGDLATADLTQWQVGPYRAQMRALDVAGNELGTCIIQFTLDN